MGTGYYRDIVQWSKGEYAKASNHEDDLAILTTANGFGYRGDDFGDTPATAGELTAAGSAVSAAGIIERNTDYDVLSFTTGAGLVTLSVDPAPRGPNLDILAELLDANGGVVAASNPIGALNASISLTLPGGTYYLRISGVGEGDPATTGYSDYGSIGQYAVSGTVAPVGAALAVSDVTVTEGADAAAVFTVTLTGPAGGPVTVDVATADGTAKAGSDYAAVSQKLTFDVGETSKTVSVPIVNDSVSEPAETFTLNLSNASGAVVELSGALPAGVPIYALNSDPFVNIETITMVGYGQSGDGVSGYHVSPWWTVKRVGANHADAYISDDEGSGSPEGWECDFDGPGKDTNLFGPPKGSNLTLGNDVETTLGGGDSGGPAFIDDGAGGLEIFGINTFSFGVKAPAPLFGSGAGGVVVAPYVEWIESIINAAPPVPGITVVPTWGLVTTEDGGTATFDVVLNTQPDADVSIALQSSDTSEGTIDKAVLAFTAADWDTPRTVTITGVDDAVADGNVAYTIVTGPASSSDSRYDGMDAADVSVTNIDNEAPVETLTITKASFSSRKGQLKIEATSSLGGDTSLSATYFASGAESAHQAMSYSARKGRWSVTITMATKPEKVRVYSDSGVWVEKTDIGGKTIPVAAARALSAGAADEPAAASRLAPPAPAAAAPLAIDQPAAGHAQSPPSGAIGPSGALPGGPVITPAAEAELGLQPVALDGKLLDGLALPLVSRVLRPGK